MKFTIDRTRWLRGEGSDVSKLLRPSDGKMCCVGFFCLAQGLSEDTINDKPTYYAVIGSIENDPFVLTGDYIIDRQETWSMYHVNDSPLLSDEEREKLLTNNFAKLGHKVEFIN